MFVIVTPDGVLRGRRPLYLHPTVIEPFSSEEDARCALTGHASGSVLYRLHPVATVNRPEPIVTEVPCT